MVHNPLKIVLNLKKEVHNPLKKVQNPKKKVHNPLKIVQNFSPNQFFKSVTKMFTLSP
jgi:hypothetical protein